MNCMKKILQEKNLWIFFVSIITTISISLNVVNGRFSFEGNDFRWILLIAVLCILISKALEKYNKRLFICSRYL